MPRNKCPVQTPQDLQKDPFQNLWSSHYNGKTLENIRVFHWIYPSPHLVTVVNYRVIISVYRDSLSVDHVSVLHLHLFSTPSSFCHLLRGAICWAPKWVSRTIRRTYQGSLRNTTCDLICVSNVWCFFCVEKGKRNVNSSNGRDFFHTGSTGLRCTMNRWIKGLWSNWDP